MLKIQELPGAMPLDPHDQDPAPGSRGPRLAAIKGLTSPPPCKRPLWIRPCIN